MLTGKVCVSFASLVAAGFVWAGGLPVTENLIFHVDATDANSLHYDAGSGDVTDWTSSVGGLKLVGTAYAATEFTSVCPKRVVENGRAGVQLTHYENGQPVRALLTVADGKSLAAKTIFVVNRQIEAAQSLLGGALFGTSTGYEARLQRATLATSADAYRWNKNIAYEDNWTSVWVNGTKDKLDFSDVGGIDRPQVTTAVRETVKENITVFGGSYFQNSIYPEMVVDKCVVHEIVAYDRVLSDDEISLVSDYLMAKWALVDTTGLPVKDDLIFHVDADDATSLHYDAESGDVTDWTSFVDGMKLVGTAYAATEFTSVCPKRVVENGRAGVQLTHYENGQPVRALLTVADGKSLAAKTIFVVNRQIEVAQAEVGGALFGTPDGFDARLQRATLATPTDAYKWNKAIYTYDWASVWVNGTKDKLDFSDVGGVERPQITTAVRETVNENITVFGGSYFQNSIYPEMVVNKCVIHEIVAYDRALSDVEIAKVSEYLMIKWDLTDVATWTGEGETTDWNEAANWKSGRKPTAATTVLFTADATVTLSGDCRVTKIKNASDAGITLTFVNETDVLLDAFVGDGIAVEKQGAGRLSLAGGQTYAGATTVAEGTLAAGGGLASGSYAAMGGLVAHLDASRPETLTTGADGAVRTWKTLVTDGADFIGADEMTYSEVLKFKHENPIFHTNALGHASVRFGCELDGTTFRGTFIRMKDGVRTMARTYFFVQTQLKASDNGGLLGMITGYDFRMYRTDNGGGSYWAWDNRVWGGVRSYMAEVWANGKKFLPDTLCTFAVSGTERPNLLVVRNPSADAFDIIGGQYLENDGHSYTGDQVYGQMDLHEAILFDTALTDEQISAVSAALMKKWDVPAQDVVMAGPGLSPNSALTLAGGATADFGDYNQKLAAVTGEGSVVSAGTLDVNGQSVNLTGPTAATHVVNTSATPATVTLAADGDCTIGGVSGNVNFTKTGAGRLSVLPGAADYTGTTCLAGGGVAVDANAYYASLGNVTLHVDASAPETVGANAGGEVETWRSVGGVETALKGADAFDYADAVKISHKNPLFLTNAQGQASVRLGREADGTTFRGTFLRRSSGDLTARTYFFVQTQLQPSSGNCGMGLLGDMTEYSRIRMYRSSTVDKAWYSGGFNGIMDKYMAESWQNGRKSAGTSDADCTFEASGAARPNLLVVRNPSVNAFGIIGGQYLENSSHTSMSDRQYGTMDLHEILFFDTALTDKQIEKVSAILMAKWGIPNQAAVAPVFENPLPTGTWTIAADTALSIVGFSQAIGALVVDLADASRAPVLAVDGDLDVTGTALSFLNAGNAEKGPFLTTTGTLTRPFASVGGTSLHVSYGDHEAKLSDGFLLLIR